MAKIRPTTELLEGILARIPEGFINRATLDKRISLHGKHRKNVIQQAHDEGKITILDSLFYDRGRLSAEQVKEYASWCLPTFPQMSKSGKLLTEPIINLLEDRNQRVEQLGDAACVEMMKAFASTSGYAKFDDICESNDDILTLETLSDIGALKQVDGLVFDPLRLGQKTIEEVFRRYELEPLRRELTELLMSKPGQAAAKNELSHKFGKHAMRDVLSLGGFSTFNVSLKSAPYKSTWVRLKGSDTDTARKIALDAVKIEDEAWIPSLAACGDILRSGAKDGTTLRSQVVARSYTISRACKYLGIRKDTLDIAVKESVINIFIDPEGRARCPAAEIERAFNDQEYGERITSFEVLKVRTVSIVAGFSYSTIRRRLKKAKFSTIGPQWGQIRGLWGLPETLPEFYEILRQKKEDRRIAVAAAHAEQQRQLEIQRELERQRREMLRAKLVDAFPTWRHDGRNEQHIYMHIGPPNSGKTHDSLNILAESGEGWYLAPLRLLAFEIFDRLNQRGVPCNLLTGEEYVPVEGATITAATIEMFNPAESGQCVVIDEAQMLAGSGRGWAWTRAMMQAEAPSIHIIGPPTVQNLIEQLSNAAAIPFTVMQHERLAPIRVVDEVWTLKDLPPYTILVAFSRRMVLHLKTELENAGRLVSVVYGSLPPEVRRRQADRFAAGETDICVATDAVGMGLNLPADRVCFYEIEKFDGQSVRLLTPSEIHQIGGRAGRYGIRDTGEIGAIHTKDLKLLQRLYDTEPEVLTHARVAPTVEDLEMIPGTLAEKLLQWSLLQSIPDSLRNVIQTADLTERIELARMLSDDQINQLGLATSVQLTNAPTRQFSRSYWYNCTNSILKNWMMPFPPKEPKRIKNSKDLETMEACISCADIYLWLSQRSEFRHFAPDIREISQKRREWSMRIDDALLNKLDTMKRCEKCGRALPLHHNYRICNRCHSSQHYHNHRNHN